jgi:hypothetical protein
MAWVRDNQGKLQFEHYEAGGGYRPDALETEVRYTTGLVQKLEYWQRRYYRLQYIFIGFIAIEIIAATAWWLLR